MKKVKRSAEQKIRCQLRTLDHRLSEAGETDFLILQELAMKGELPATKLAGRVGLTSGSMTAALNRLEKAGSLKRRRTPLDRRCVLVSLTDRGRETALVEHKRQQKRLKKALGVFSERELSLFSGLLKRAAGALED